MNSSVPDDTLADRKDEEAFRKTWYKLNYAAQRFAKKNLNGNGSPNPTELLQLYDKVMLDLRKENKLYDSQQRDEVLNDLAKDGIKPFSRSIRGLGKKKQSKM
jgi:hypothetical protein